MKPQHATGAMAEAIATVTGLLVTDTVIVLLSIMAGIIAELIGGRLDIVTPARR